MASQLERDVARFRRRLDQGNRATIRALADAYGRAWQRIQRDVDTLVDQIADARASGEVVNASWLRQQARYESLQRQIELEVLRFSREARGRIEVDRIAAVRGGSQDAAVLLESAFGRVPQGISVTLNQLPSAAVRDLVANLQRTAPLGELLSELPAETRRRVESGLIDGLTKGRHPRRIARDMRHAGYMPLRRASLIARTEVFRAYRSSSMETYRQNANVLEGWMWYSQLDDRTCFPAYTWIDTAQCMKPIRDVQVDDWVLTHTGRFQRVYETLKREVVSGHFVTIKTGDSAQEQVTATAEHPFLVEREGELDWIEACDIRLTDKLVRKIDRTANVIDHGSGKIPIKRRVWDAYHAVAATLKPKGLALVSFLNRLQPMPVDTVNFKDGIDLRQVEVNRPRATNEAMLLQVVNPQGLERESNIPFWDSLTGEASVAANTTEPLIHCGNTAKRFTTRWTGDHLRWTSAFFRTIGSIISTSAKDCSASLTSSVLRFSVSAAKRTIRVPICITASDAKILLAPGTLFRHLAPGNRATAAAKRSLFIVGTFERLAALLAFIINSRFCLSTSTTTWMLALIGKTTFVATEFPATFTDPGSRNTEAGLAFDTDTFHAVSISSLAHHIQTETVYNLEVEKDHSYVANGFAVHNCLGCWMQHGTIHTLDEELDDHPGGRCSKVPRTRSWKDLGYEGIPDTRPQIEPGRDVFEQLPDERKATILGPSKWKAYQDGDISVDDLSGIHSDATWGRTIQERSLKSIVGLERSEELIAAAR